MFILFPFFFLESQLQFLPYFKSDSWSESTQRSFHVWKWSHYQIRQACAHTDLVWRTFEDQCQLVCPSFLFSFFFALIKSPPPLLSSPFLLLFLLEVKSTKLPVTSRKLAGQRAMLEKNPSLGLCDKQLFSWNRISLRDSKTLQTKCDSTQNVCTVALQSK